MSPLLRGLAAERVRTRAGCALSWEPGYGAARHLRSEPVPRVGFYAALAEELASHGYVVIGIDHPYQVAAADIGSGRVALYEPDDVSKPIGEMIARKIDERIADVEAILDALRADAAGISLLAGQLDLERIASRGIRTGASPPPRSVRVTLACPRA